ncbi:class II fructose-bisphosphate aldolase [Schaalia sp. Marseille-Q2122]|uniref:class II fructose-bisphosphate aldolase n=1 Tax=Schaalia sp. Marseille-Q2122 TaxID=2736604 RepID=UPI001C37650E|nr:class II fructose-bisphosphate aldolase [Schaalia sp. Marseille-Q2122]
MMKASTLDIVTAAQEQGYAVGAFNVFDDLSLRAVARAAQEQRSPVIIQISVRTAKAIGAELVADMFSAAATSVDVPLSLHLDHCPDPTYAMEVIDAGWSSVLFDASSYDLPQARELTAAVAAHAHQRGAHVESEIENIVGVEDGVGSDVIVHAYSDEELVTVAQETGVDMIAPQLGTAHGLYKGRPALLPERVRRLRTMTSLPIVLHGGTGLSPEDFASFIAAGVSKINVSTALKHSFLDALVDVSAEARAYGRVEPLPILAQIEQRVAGTVAEHLALFGSCGAIPGGAQ